MSVTAWSSAAWRSDVESWLDQQLAAAGVQRTGELTQLRLRPWGTVLRAPTSIGPVWLKAPGPDTVFEVGLYQLLHRVTPDRVLRPLAVDVDRGWVLLPDGGPTLAESIGTGGGAVAVAEASIGAGGRTAEVAGVSVGAGGGTVAVAGASVEALVGALVEVLPQYAELQRDLMPEVGDLLDIGVADMRAEVMPERFEEALEAVSGYVEYSGDPADRAAYEQVIRLRGRFAGWCEQLAAATVAASLDHNDLHLKNILSEGAGPVRFYDWGDSVVAHPFSSLLVALGTVRRDLGVSPDDPAIRRPRDAYLEVFGPPASLLAELRLACQVAKVARALTWQRALRGHSFEEVGDFAAGPLRTLAALRSDSWLDLG